MNLPLWLILPLAVVGILIGGVILASLGRFFR